MKRLWGYVLVCLVLAGCVSADPQVVAQAVKATLTAALTPTPIVVVVTALSAQNQPIPTITPPPPPTATLLATATATAASLPSATPAASATLLEPTASVTPSAIGYLVFDDDFLQPGLWDLGSGSSVEQKVLAGSWLSVTIKLADRFTVFYQPQSVPNVYAQTTVVWPVCHTRDRAGLIFRVNDVQNYYQFDVDCDGRYRLSKMVGGTLTALVDWTANAALHAGNGATNELSVRAAGAQLTVSANGLALAKVTDPTFTLGGFGFCVGSGLSVPYTAAFDRLRVWEVVP